MQATIVAFYGEKPTELTALIHSGQERIGHRIREGFRPYSIEQVHTTIVGLEGTMSGDHVLNDNFWELRGKEQAMQFSPLLNFLRSGDILPFQVRIGGFSIEKGFSFTSKDEHPYYRSFSVQGEIAVTMGWPYKDGLYPDPLYQLRHRLEEFNVLHKYHKRASSVDNDLFFVLGRVNRRAVTEDLIRDLEDDLRSFMADMTPPILAEVRAEYVSIIGYTDSQLPLETSLRFPILDPSLDEDRLLALYQL